jgi:multidrug resistance efflux pump
LRKGARVASLPPAMAFIERSETIVGVQIAQINVRHVKSGQPSRSPLKYLPWRSFPGKVETILQAVSGSQTQVSGQAARLDDFYLV